MRPKLSILIATMPRRRAYLHRLMGILSPQLNDQVEVKTISDDGELTIGQKRNGLVAMADGEYLCHVDDDDRVADNYVERVLRACAEGKDAVSLAGRMTIANHPRRPWTWFFHSIKHGREWHEQQGVYFRPPNHLNAVRTELARQVPFLNLHHGEDHDYSHRLFPLLKKEADTGREALYYYDHRPGKLPADEAAMKIGDVQ